MPAIVLLFLGFGSCASGTGGRSQPKDPPPGGDYPFVYLTNTVKFMLLPTSGIGKPVDMPQRISASFRDHNMSMLAWVKADETIIALTLLNEMGTTVGELLYSDGAVSFSSKMLPASVKPEYIVADFQFCFYNEALIASALESCGLSLEIDGAAYRIFNGKDMIYEIIKNPDAVVLTNHLRGYTYTLEGDYSAE